MPGATSVLLQRHGQVMVELYARGADAQTLHDTRSAGKSITGLLVAAAVQDGLLRRDSPVFAALADAQPLANDAPAKQGIVVEDLLTMSSALDCDDNQAGSPGNEENMYPQQRRVAPVSTCARIDHSKLDAPCQQIRHLFTERRRCDLVFTAAENQCGASQRRQHIAAIRSIHCRRLLSNEAVTPNGSRHVGEQVGQSSVAGVRFMQEPGREGAGDLRRQTCRAAWPELQQPLRLRSCPPCALQPRRSFALQASTFESAPTPARHSSGQAGAAEVSALSFLGPFDG
ncbi:serine hydrolase [Rhizobacter sp. P5_C2]